MTPLCRWNIPLKSMVRQRGKAAPDTRRPPLEMSENDIRFPCSMLNFSHFSFSFCLFSCTVQGVAIGAATCRIEAHRPSEVTAAEQHPVLVPLASINLNELATMMAFDWQNAQSDTFRVLLREIVMHDCLSLGETRAHTPCHMQHSTST